MSPALKLNPFERPTVDDPRDPMQTVDSIHQEQLNQLLSSFNIVEQQEKPRLKKGALAQRVMSDQQGSGKSHLLGRVWKALSSRATLIYLRANQDRANLWKRMLERTVQELEYPGNSQELVLKPGMPSQLDCLARHILCDLAARALEEGVLQPDTEDLSGLETDPVGFLGKEQNRKDLRDSLDKLLPILSARLAESGLKLEAGVNAWLAVLTHYTTRSVGDPIRALAISWIQGSALEEEDACEVGLARHEIPPGDMSEESRNEEAFRRLKDLCALGAFYRPFVFAFDQTELYNQTPELARAFGAMIARLQAECINQYTVVTANETVWLDTIARHFERADLDRFSQKPITLAGINAPQARALVEIKMKAAGYTNKVVQEFLERDWFKKLFAGGPAGLPSPRIVENAAKVELDGEIRQPPLPEIVEEYRLRILKTPKATDFDGGTLHWVFFTGLAGLPGVGVDPVFRTPKGYLNIRWEMDETRTLFFVINDSNVWNRWRAIVNEFKTCAQKEKDAGREAKAVAVWHSRLGEIGTASQTHIDEGKRHGFRLLTLDDAQTAELYAGEAVSADMRQGDLKPHSEEQLIAFLGQHLSAWKDKIWGENSENEKNGGEDIPPLDPELIKEIVKKSRSLTWPILERRLRDRTQVTYKIDLVLVACQPLADDIRVFSTPSNHFFLWQRRSG